AHHAPVDVVLETLDQAAPVEQQQRLRHGSLGEAEVIGEGLRSVGVAVGPATIDERLKVNGLQRLVRSGLAQLGTHQVAEALEEFEKHDRILVQSLSLPAEGRYAH